MKTFGNIIKKNMERQLQTSAASSFKAVECVSNFYLNNNPIIILYVLRSNIYNNIIMLFNKNYIFFFFGSFFVYLASVNSGVVLAFDKLSRYTERESTSLLFSPVRVRISLGYNSSERRFLI